VLSGTLNNLYEYFSQDHTSQTPGFILIRLQSLLILVEEHWTEGLA